MSEENSPLPEHLRHKFPDLRPVKKPPTLHTINGIGASVYGRRDFDDETGTYVKTHCFCVLFIPLIAIGAYRVADAGPGQGWYFIGKERLSPFAKIWNWAMLGLAIVGAAMIAQSSYTSSPDYQAQQDLKRAAEMMKAGKPLAAAGIYRGVAGGNARAQEGWRGLQESLEQCFNADSPETVAGAFRIVAGVQRGVLSQNPPITEPFKRGLSLVEKFRPKDPEGALTVLHAVVPLAPTNALVRPVEIDLLKTILAARPDNTNRAVELALIYEEDNQLDESCRVLAPLKQKLGSTEGARILGQNSLQQGNYDEAYSLLFPYVQARLADLHRIEKNYTNAMAAAYRRAIDGLNDGKAERSFYAAYDKASKADQETMVENYVAAWMRTDSAFQHAIGELTAANRIVHVTLDLGIVQLNRAQSLADPAARKAELEAAERTFVAIHGLAGDTDEYRLFLGQVYYWLGKSKQGQELFDQLLASNQRAYSLLMAVSRTLREVGEEVRARGVTEEAYRTAKTDQEKFNAASLRARLQTDNDDEIAWLEKCDQAEPSIQIELNSARGDKALRAGDRELAAQFFHKATAGYRNMPKSAVILNNHALACLNLYEVTGNIQDHNQGLALLEEALSLSPGNSLMLMNTAQLMFTRAYMDVVGDAVRFGAMQASPNQGMLHLLYNDESERKQIYQRVREDEYMKKALGYLDKALLLAPKSITLYWWELRAQSAFRDLPELQKLQQRLQVAALDLTETRRETLQAYSGAKDKEHLAQRPKEILRLEKLLEKPAVREHPLSREYAQIELNEYRRGAVSLGEAVDARPILDEARAIYQQDHNSAARDNLVTALFLAAHEDLRRQSPEYARLADQWRRSLSPRLLICCLLEREHGLAPGIRKNPNLLEAAGLLKERAQRFPGSITVTDWALFRTLEPEVAASFSRQLKENKAALLANEIEFQLNPYVASSVLGQYWTRRMSGDDAGAKRIYEQALRDGVPLPPP